MDRLLQGGPEAGPSPAAEDPAAATAATAATAAAPDNAAGGSDAAAPGPPPPQPQPASSKNIFMGWTLDMLQAASVLAGCDFLPSIKGVAFKTAAMFVGRHRTLDATLDALGRERRFAAAATPAYCAAARAAALNFRHALGACAFGSQGGVGCGEGRGIVCGGCRGRGKGCGLRSSISCAHARTAPLPAVFCAQTDGGSCRRLTPLPPCVPGEEQEPEELSGQLAQLGDELAADVARGIAYGAPTACAVRCALLLHLYDC